MKPIRIATRGSRLALVQTEYVRNILAELSPDTEITIVKVSTRGDRDKSDFLHKSSSVGFFTSEVENAILDGTDAEMMTFAKENLNYNRNKGLDFIGRFNGKYVIGEAKFLTDFGGHQNAQFNDAIETVKVKNVKAEKIAILDGVLYINGNSKMNKEISTRFKKYNVLSALVLRDFLYQL